MGSNVQVNADLADLSVRLRTVAEELKHSVPEKIEDLCEEVRAIAAQLRGPQGSQGLASRKLKRPRHYTRQAEWQA